jgi:GNAT superfamily N-acetyltransferase
MTPPFIIQPLTNADSPQIVDLILPIQQQEFNVPITIEKQPDLLDVEAAYFRTGGHFWGAIATTQSQHPAPSITAETGQLLGTIALLPIGHHAAALRKMFVRKEFRGKDLGIAQHLMNTLLDYCRERDISTIYLGTIDSMKAAHRFYERNRFIPIARPDLPEFYPNMPTDNMYYYRTINNYAQS